MSLVAVEDLFPGSGKAGACMAQPGVVCHLTGTEGSVTARMGVSQTPETSSEPPGEAVPGRKSLGVPCGTAG